MFQLGMLHPWRILACRNVSHPLYCGAADCSTEHATAAVGFMRCQTYFQSQLTCGESLLTPSVTGVQASCVLPPLLSG
jgi:hypothetical protein